MNREEKTIARSQFKIKIYEANGQKFEDLFTSIMQYHDVDFQQIKPWGNIGDRGNDGYILSKGIFYQVFAPEDIKKSYPQVINKLNNDFSKVLNQWNDIKEFYFVVNDKYKGINADCEQKIKNIKSLHNLRNASFMTAKSLEDILFKLEDDQIFSIIGFLPNPANIRSLDYPVLGEIMNHIMGLSLSTTEDSSIIYPDWDKKIKFNGLGPLATEYLSNGSLQIGSLDEYLNNQSVFYANEVKDKVREIYKANSEEHSGDALFWKMVDTISVRSEGAYQAASIVLISKYFETCDVFEEPK